MTLTTEPGGDPQRVTHHRRVDQVCDRFEAAWNAKGRPVIENFLGDATGAERAALLRELLALELELRRRDGECPTVAHYLSRFPEHREVVDDAFTLPSAFGTLGSDTAPYLATQLTSSMASSISVTGCSPHGSRYRIVRPHARGGLGEVFVAEDLELHREVALKEIQKRHADNEVNRGRFVLEAEVTGRLEHPGIVPVYGLGTYDDGRPYYAMRFIRGDNLKTAAEQFHAPGRGGKDADFHSVEFRQLLGRFIAVCNAIAFAHSRGVLHRDLKPGNIMLGEFGETLVVDWGLAKVVGQKHAASVAPLGKDDTPVVRGGDSGHSDTAPGEMIGTPAFMSPEQAAGKVSDFGPPTDIYGLGATLYTLLTNKAPVAGGNLWDVMEKVQRGDWTPPRTANPAIPAALSAICCMAMALKPADRYSTAMALAEDLEHWLADEPVRAYGEPALVRAGRWTRKHPRTVTGLAAAVLVGVVGLAAGLYFVNAEQKRTENARRGEQTQRIEAQARESEMRAVLSFMENKVLAAARPKSQDGGLGRDVRLRTAIDAALPFVDKSFVGQPLIEARVRRTFGVSFWYLGDAKGAAGEQFRTARALYTEHLGPDHPETLRITNNLALSLDALGQHVAALKLLEETLELMKAKLGPNHPDTLRSMTNLANCFQALGRQTDALKLREITLALQKEHLGADHHDTLSSMNNLAVSYYTIPGREDDALKLFQSALALMQAKLGPDHPDSLTSLNNLANMYMTLGRSADALKLQQDTLALLTTSVGPDHPATLLCMHSMAITLQELGRHADAVELQVKTLALRQAKLGPHKLDTLASMYELASAYHALGRHAEALKLREETLKLRREHLGADHSSTLESMNNLANQYGELGRHADAYKLYEEAFALRKAGLGPDDPDTLFSMGNLASGLARLGRGAEAVPLIDECLKRAAGRAVHPLLISTVMDLRLQHFEMTKDAAGCRVTAEMWENLTHRDGVSLYRAARMRAVTATVFRAGNPSAAAAKDAADEADRAMAWLKKAIAAGYKDAASLKQDKDLDVLRDREDFKKLVAELETGKPN